MHLASEQLQVIILTKINTHFWGAIYKIHKLFLYRFLVSTRYSGQNYISTIRYRQTIPQKEIQDTL